MSFIGAKVLMLGSTELESISRVFLSRFLKVFSSLCPVPENLSKLSRLAAHRLMWLLTRSRRPSTLNVAFNVLHANLQYPWRCHQ